MFVPKQIIKAHRFQEWCMNHGGHGEHGAYKSFIIYFSVFSVTSVVNHHFNSQLNTKNTLKILLMRG